MNTVCPHCSEEMTKVIFAGFPMMLCNDDDCSTVTGFWSWVATISIELGAPPAFAPYEGNYWYALRQWCVWRDGSLDGRDEDV